MIGDFKLTEEGDLELGDQLVNEEGYLLYYTELGSTAMTIEPGESGIPVRDLEMTWGDEAEAQLIMSRLRTENPDWLLHDGIGADISDLIGEPNTQETAAIGVEKIRAALTYGNTFLSEELEIIPIPISATEILFDIWVNRAIGVSRYPVIIDLEYGLLNYYEVKA